MKSFFITTLVISNFALACSEETVEPSIYTERWNHNGDLGVTIFTQKNYKSRVVSSLDLILSVSPGSSLSVPIDTTHKPTAERLKINLKNYNASYIYLTDDLFEKAEILLTYDFEYEEDEPVLSCGSLMKKYKLKELANERT